MIRQPCDCGGYHFPHRRGGGACYYSSRADFYHARSLPLKERMEFLSAADLDRLFPLQEESSPKLSADDEPWEHPATTPGPLTHLDNCPF